MQKNVFHLLFILTLLLSACNNTTERTYMMQMANANDSLRFDRPASIWEETVPVGNGRLGLTPYGGLTDDHVVLNEISMWSGSVADYSNPRRAQSMARFRQLFHFACTPYSPMDLAVHCPVPENHAIISHQ